VHLARHVRELAACGGAASANTPPCRLHCWQGYGLSKISAVKVVATVKGGPERDRLLCMLLIGGYVPMALSVALLNSSPWGRAAGIFLASFPAGWSWGVLCLYVEGRQATGALLAAMNTAFIFGGGAARAVAAGVIESGTPAHQMPLLVSACPPPPPTSSAAVQCSAVQCSGVQCSGVQWSAVECSAIPTAAAAG
jgi:hypothetical protein